MNERISRASAEFRRRSAEFREDVRESTDASLLTFLRFLGLLYGPIDRRARIDVAFRKALAYRLPGHVGWRHALGGITYLLLIVLVATGALLAFYYRPSAQEAYASIQHIVSTIPFGWLLRELHVWAGSAIVVVLLAHMARVFFDGAYKPPRETNWLVGIGLLVVVLAFGATGYVLPWDQWAYWTVTEFLGVIERFPVLGGFAAEMLKGDRAVSGATLSRHFAIHVIILPWMLLGLVMLHFSLARQHGVAPPKLPSRTARPAIPFFPHHLLRSLAVATVVLAVLISLAAWFPRPVPPPADPSAPPSSMGSSWVLVPVSRGLLRYLGGWGFVAMGASFLVLALLPLLDRSPERLLRRRPAVILIGVLFFGGLVAAWVAGRTTHPPILRDTPAPAVSSDDPLPLPSPGPTPIRPAPAEESGR